MKFFLLGILFLFFGGCIQKHNKNEKINSKDSSFVRKEKPLQTSQSNIRPNDTTISFSINGLSSEGSEASVHYINGRISNAKWRIFGEIGQLSIQYTFLIDGTVKAIERKYEYKTDLLSVSSDSDMTLASSLHYGLDTSGILHSKVNKGFVNLFTDFKRVVPFDLK